MNEKIPTIRPTAVFGLEQARIALGLAKNCLWATNADNSVTTTSFTVQGTDVASTVAADQSSVTQPEGAAVSNTGTFSDVDECRDHQRLGGNGDAGQHAGDLELVGDGAGRGQPVHGDDHGHQRRQLGDDHVVHGARHRAQTGGKDDPERETTQLG